MGTSHARSPAGGRRALFRNWQLWMLVAPAAVLVFLFHYVPMYGVQLAFREFNPATGLTGGDWVGLKYFLKFVRSFQFQDLIWNTVSISVYNIIVGFPFPVLLALMINQIGSKSFRRVMQTVVYMPHFISVVVLAGMLTAFLSPSSGILSRLLEALGAPPVNYLGDPQYFRTIFVFSGIWQDAGWVSILYLASLTSMDTQIYDACRVDGASKWQQIVYIDLPYLIPTMIVVFILSSGSVMNVGFEKAFLLQNAMNLSSSEVISTYIYKIGLISNQFSYSAAIGLFNSLINCLILVCVNCVSSRAARISLW